MKIVNRQEIPQTNNMMDSMDVYEFALGLFGLQIDLIGFLQRIDYCYPSIDCMQPLIITILKGNPHLRLSFCRTVNLDSCKLTPAYRICQHDLSSPCSGQ